MIAYLVQPAESNQLLYLQTGKQYYHSHEFTLGDHLLKTTFLFALYHLIAEGRCRKCADLSHLSGALFRLESKNLLL